MLLEDDATSISSRTRLLASAVVVGALTGVTVSLFKLTIALTAILFYGYDATHGWIGTSDRLGKRALFFPALGGLLVAALRNVSPRGCFGPSLAGHVAEVDGNQSLDVASFACRAAAAVATLGSGNSLGPEGPSVELGVGLSRLIGAAATSRGGWRGEAHLRRRQRQLLAAGAAAGVAAGFNAPVAGVFFALEVAAAAVRAAVPDEDDSMLQDKAGVVAISLDARRDSAELDVKSRSSISGIVVSAVVATVIAQEILGAGHALASAAWPARLRLAALPLYIGLGAASGVTALTFKRLTAATRAFFTECTERNWLPRWLQPASAGLLSALVSVVFPQVLFFGYSTLDAILDSGAATAAGGVAEGALSMVASSKVVASCSPLPRGSVGAQTLMAVLKGTLGGAGGRALLPWPGVGLLCAKLLTTSVSVASGLVGGTFAPSLLLGAALGVVYQQAAVHLLAGLAVALPAKLGAKVRTSSLVSNVPAFAMVGAASMLSSVFHAPLTAAMLLFELTRGEELMMPLLAAAGIGPVVCDAIERRLTARAAVATTATAAAGNRAEKAADTSQDGRGITMPDECDVDNEMNCTPESTPLSRPL